MTRTNSHRPSSTSATAAASLPDKPKAQLLSFFLPALIIALILSLFFIFAGAVAIVALLHLCLLGGALHRRCSRRHNHHYLLDYDDAPPKLSSAELRKLPRTRFRAKLETARGWDGDLCVICLEDLIDGEWCRELPDCKHVFHANCVDTWLAKALACPFCRSTVRLPEEDKSASKQLL